MIVRGIDNLKCVMSWRTLIPSRGATFPAIYIRGFYVNAIVIQANTPYPRAFSHIGISTQIASEIPQVVILAGLRVMVFESG